MAESRDAFLSLRAPAQERSRGRCGGSCIDRQPRMYRTPSPSVLPRIWSIQTNSELILIRGRSVSWSDVRFVALEVNTLLEEMGLRGWPRTAAHVGAARQCPVSSTVVLHGSSKGCARSVACDGTSSACACEPQVVEGKRHGVSRLRPECRRIRPHVPPYSVRPLPDTCVPRLFLECGSGSEPSDFTSLPFHSVSKSSAVPMLE